MKYKIPCSECGALTDGYCFNCGYITARITPFRSNGQTLNELKIVCASLADLCNPPTTKLSDVQHGLKEYKLCPVCRELHDQTGRFCSLDCSLENEADRQEQEATGN